MLLHSGNRFFKVFAILALSSLCTAESLWAQLSCIENINLSLDGDCESLIDHTDILSFVDPMDTYSVMLTDHSGNLISGNLLTSAHLGTTVMAKVTNSSSNSCWGTINVEDKMAPIITCMDITVDCFDSNQNAPMHVDNCTTSSIELIGETLRTLDCDMNHIKELNRTWEAKDIYGNSSVCNQNVRLRRINFMDISFPNSFELDNDTELTCNEITFDEDGFPNVSITGVPMLNGSPIFPNNDVYCNIGVQKEDILVAALPCTRKYMRTWTVYEAWCNTSPSIEFVQTIEISDTENPSISSLTDINLAADANNNCEATLNLPLPTVSDDCTDVVNLDISYDGGFLRNVTSSPTVTLPAGVNVVNYTVYDFCGNSSSTSLNVIIGDDSAPIAVCDDQSVVSLRSDGTAKAWSNTFDDGSFDNCGSIVQTLVKRLDQTCGCDRPEFKEMTYLGDLNGRLYYLSESPVYGYQAIAFSQAYGGMPLTLESQSEAEWVHEKVSAITNLSYYIGLAKKASTNNFVYPDHSSPLYTNWSMGEPNAMGTHVVVGNSGEWNAVAGNTERHFFLYEATDPCGYGEEVNFCCQDAGNNVMISFRVMDAFGGFNDCMVTVEVQDKVAPIIQCPSNMVLDCSTNINTNNLSVYGSATATDVCLNPGITESFTSNINSCGVGQIIRTFTASDANSQASCTQVISLLASSASTSSAIDWPDDYDSTDGCTQALDPDELPDGFDRPDFTGASCTQLSATYVDKTFTFPGDGSNACFKILRTWTVVDGCMQGMTGYEPETYEQTIKVDDTIAPVLSGCANMTVNTTSCMAGPISIDVSATDNCTSGSGLNGRLSVDLFSDNSAFEITMDYDGPMVMESDMFPLGSHTIVIEFFDGCGNKGSCSYLLNVVNDALPVANCQNITIPLQEMDLDGDGNFDAIMAQVNAVTFDGYNSSLGSAGSTHPCNYSLNYAFGDGTTSKVFDCSQIGTSIMNVVVTASNGQSDTCQPTVTITDDGDLCANINGNTNGGTSLRIIGAVETSVNEPVQSVNIELMGSEMNPYETDTNGQYAFDNVESGASYMIMPSKNDDLLNGVSTLDIINIERHISGSNILENPYDLIAADVNNSGTITAIDLIELRKLILGITDEFPNNTSWRLIDKDHHFLNPKNPFEQGIPENYTILNLQNNMEVNFVGVKVGDVNNSADPGVDTTHEINKRNRGRVDLYVTNDRIAHEDTFESLFEFDNVQTNGFQLSLKYDATQIRVEKITSTIENFSNSNYKIDHELGIINVSWNGRAGLNTKQLFKISGDLLAFDIKDELFELNTEGLEAESYKNEEVFNLQLKFNEQIKSTGVKLFRNQPNPWAESTTIAFESSSQQEVEFNFYDVNGRLLYRELRTAQKGLNKSVIDHSIFSNGGIIYYELITKDERLVEKMFLVK